MINFDNKKEVESFIEELNVVFISKGIQNAVIERKGKLKTTDNSQTINHRVNFQIIFPVVSQQTAQILEGELKDIFRKQRFSEVEITPSESSNQNNTWAIVAHFRKSK